MYNFYIRSHSTPVKSQTFSSRQLSSENEQLRRAVSRGKREEGSRLNNRPSRSPKHSAARGTRTTSRSRSRSRIARSRSRGRGRLSPAAAAEEKRRRSHSGDRYNDADELVSSEDAGGGGPEDEFVVGAVQICNRLTEVYNRKVPANIGMEKKGASFDTVHETYLVYLARKTIESSATEETVNTVSNGNREVMLKKKRNKKSQLISSTVPPALSLSLPHTL